MIEGVFRSRMAKAHNVFEALILVTSLKMGSYTFASSSIDVLALLLYTFKEESRIGFQHPAVSITEAQ